MKEKIKKYKLLILSSLIIVIIGCIAITFMTRKKQINQTTVETDTYYLQYDETWSLKNNTDKTAELLHGDEAILKLEIINLEDEYEYSKMSEMIDEIIYNINQNNKDYKLINKEEKPLTENEYEGYRLLYENDNSEVLISVFKTDDKLVTFTYEAESNYFDIILDSVNSIIFKFKLKETNIDIEHKIDLVTKNMSLPSDSDFDSQISETTEYEIAHNNYCVKYSIPTIFKETDFNSQLGYFSYTDEDYSKTASISTSILNKNVYEELDGNNSLDLVGKYSSYADKQDFKESISKQNKDGYEVFIYKNKYYDDSIIDKNKKILNENLVIIYPLNYNHILEITITTRDIEISENLLNSIKVNSVQNYSSYLKSSEENNTIISNLKRKVRIDDESKVETITLKVSNKYKELNTEYNIYEQRKYGLDYNENLEVYDYEVEYWVRSGSTEDIINSANSVLSTYGTKQTFEKIGDIEYNTKMFEVFKGSEENISGIMYTNINRTTYKTNKTILIQKLEDNKQLVITIKGNNKEISDDIINELTNFNIEIK